jgi:hypothetical protein
MTIFDDVIGHADHEYDHIIKNVERSHDDKEVKPL